MEIIQGGAWRTENLFKNPAIEAKVVHNEEFSEVTLSENKYSLARVISNIGRVKGNHFYKITVDTEKACETTDIDILEIWYDSKGTELLRQYVDKDRDSLSPEEADSLDVYVLIRGKDRDTVKILLPQVECIKPYEKREVTLAAVSLDYAPIAGRDRTMQDNLDESIKKIDKLCNSDKKPDLIILTEDFSEMRVNERDRSRLYLKLNGDYIKALRDKAREHGIYLSFSFSEVDEKGNYYNSAPLIDRQGEIVLNYHKTHLTMKELAKGIIPGDEIAVYDTDFGRVGMAICWDLYFNGMVNLLRDRNVEVIINPSLGYWDDINSMRAEDSGAYVLTAGANSDKTAVLRPEGTCDSNKVIDYGNILDKGSIEGNDGIAIATVDLNKRYPVRYLSAPSTAERRNVYKNEANRELYRKYADI